MTRLSEAELADVRTRNPVAEVAERLGIRLRRSGRSLIGACPICGGNASKAARFEIKTPESWACAVCQDGGDVIRLVERVQGISFRSAVEWLGGVQAVDPAEAARRERDRAAKQAKRDRDSAHFRERERRQLYGLWRSAVYILGTLAEAYLDARGVTVAAGCLRYINEINYFHGTIEDERGRRGPRSIHRGPAMLAPIVGPDGRFAGLHTTYLDSHGAKAEIFDPDTGEKLSSKKVRGSMAGGHISLSSGKDAADRLVMGEGIETTGSVATAEAETLVWDRTIYWAAIALGNFGGRAMGTVIHPTAKHSNGHPVRVPDEIPDFAAPAISIPDQITEIVLLGDGDSDRLTTRLALKRAVARYRRPGRIIRIAWAPEGRDFNDVLLRRV